MFHVVDRNFVAVFYAIPVNLDNFQKDYSTIVAEIVEMLWKFFCTFLSLASPSPQHSVTAKCVSYQVKMFAIRCGNVLLTKRNIVFFLGGGCYSFHQRAVWLRGPLKAEYCIFISKFRCVPNNLATIVGRSGLIYLGIFLLGHIGIELFLLGHIRIELFLFGYLLLVAFEY